MINQTPTIQGHAFQYNATQTAIDILIKQTKTMPHQIAIMEGERSLTYQELLNSVYNAAAQLTLLGVQPGDNVVLILEASSSLVSLILAILLCGANYTSIDNNYPLQRIQHMIKTNACKFLIGEHALLSKIHLTTPIMVIDVNTLTLLNTTAPKKTMTPAAKANDIAYIVYTSGSTGLPKGIKIPHQAMHNHMAWMKIQFLMNNEDRFLLKTPLAFDPSVWEIFLPFYAGATLVIAKTGTHANPLALKNYVKKYGITILQLVPVILHQFLLNSAMKDRETLRYVFVGGESLETSTKELFFKTTNSSCNLINLYGPAEATIDTTYYHVKNDKETILHNYIGKPIYNVSLFILNEQQEPCSPGEIGELCIAGDNLFHGYTDPTLNKKAFTIIDCDHKKIKIYKTGDLVKLSEHGEVEYIGRKDNQIKINGVRIEPEEIKQAILKNSSAQQVFISHDVSKENNNKQLICFLVSKKNIDINQLRNELEKHLPTYMIPHQFYVIDRPFLSPNGKFDAAKAKEAACKNLIIPSPVTTNIIRDPIEKKLIEVWSSLLNRPLCHNDLDSDFYDLGGDSITAFILCNKLQNAFSINLTIDQLILCQTMQKQAQHIKAMLSHTKTDLIDRVLVSLNEPADINLYLIHPIGGTIFWYLRLAKLLNKKIHIYGIQDPGILTGKTLFNSIEEMADYYAACISSRHPNQPILIGGASFGATIAIETARKLNHPIERIIILDGWAVYPNELRNKDYFLQSMLRQQQTWKDKMSETSYPVDFQNMFDIQLHRLHLLFNYHMRPIDFHLDIFKAQETIPLFETFDNPYNHWNQFAKNYQLYSAAGDHETMFLDPNVSSLAEKLASIIAVPAAAPIDLVISH